MYPAGVCRGPGCCQADGGWEERQEDPWGSGRNGAHLAQVPQLSRGGAGTPFPRGREAYFNLLKTLSILLINLTLKDWNLHPVLFFKYTNDK